jgi:demethoxyubiquinone hydroxylase (CLK1/Coq7/Cat5 family)
VCNLCDISHDTLHNFYFKPIEKSKIIMNSMISQMLRVNHAGEVAAQAIYQGQLKVFVKGNTHELIKHMYSFLN